MCVAALCWVLCAGAWQQAFTHIQQESIAGLDRGRLGSSSRFCTAARSKPRVVAAAEQRGYAAGGGRSKGCCLAFEAVLQPVLLWKEMGACALFACFLLYLCWWL